MPLPFDLKPLAFLRTIKKQRFETMKRRSARSLNGWIRMRDFESSMLLDTESFMVAIASPAPFLLMSKLSMPSTPFARSPHYTTQRA